MKTVRDDTSHSNAFSFEVQYVSCSDACKHVCYVVDEVIAPDKGSNPSTPSSRSSLSEFSGSTRSYCSSSCEEESLDCDVKT